MKMTFSLGALLGASLLSINAMAVDCSSLPTWSNSQVYNTGNQVQYDNYAYTANYWTQSNNPATHSGPWQHWTNNGVCDGSTPPSSAAASSVHSSIYSTSSSMSSNNNGGSCPQYAAGTSYNLNQVVINGGNTYTCQVPGWCSSTAAWAYEPGVGQHWETAWNAGGSCDGASSSAENSSAVSSSPVSSSSANSSLAPVTDNQLVGYWENWHWPLLEPSAVPNYTVLNISFPRINADGSLTLTNADFTQNNPTPAQVAAAQAQGKKVLLSIGGATVSLVLNNSTHEDNFVNSFIAIADEWGLDGIDIDTESGLYTAPNALINETNPQYSADHLVRAVKRIKAHYGSDFLVTVAPETAHTIGAMLPGNWQGSINWGVYLPFLNALSEEISWVQMQYYNTGSMPGLDGNFYNSATQDGLVAWTEAMIEGFPIASTGVSYQGLPASKIVIGLPASSTPSAAGSGYTDPNIVKAALRCLRSGDCGSGYQPAKTYPDLRGVMAWSVNEDAMVNYFFSNSLEACVLQNQCN